MFRKIFLGMAVMALVAGGVFAQTLVDLSAGPDTSQETDFTADVHEQARVLVPATVNFEVADVAADTDADAAASVDITQIALAAGNQLKVSIASPAAFSTPAAESTATWAASSVSWASTWTNGTNNDGALTTDSSYTEVATCDEDPTGAACSTDDLLFTLASDTDVIRAGNHTLTITWKFQSI
ncbi:MAG TPA: hypothetical protein VEW48_24190 [Thermoanaerobaculia bacterium]|nr:hypothetical protein [Thermoanaerobaculia bacterium]